MQAPRLTRMSKLVVATIAATVLLAGAATAQTPTTPLEAGTPTRALAAAPAADSTLAPALIQAAPTDQFTAQDTSGFSLSKKLCKWSNAPLPPDLSQACVPLSSVVPGQPVYYEVQIFSVANANNAPWSVNLTEQYQPGFASNVQSVRCANASSNAATYTAANPLATLLGPIPVPSAGQANCAMAGFFTTTAATDTNAGNLVTLSAAGITTISKSVNATLDTTAPLPTNLRITKTSDVTTGPLGSTVNFTITLENDANGSDVFLGGGLLRFSDRLFNYGNTAATISYVGTTTCTPLGGGSSCIDVSNMAGSFNVPASTWQWQAFQRSFPAADPGFLPKGGALKIQYALKATGPTCKEPTTSIKLSNEAGFDLAGLLGTTVADLNPVDNSVIYGPVNVTTANLPDCPPKNPTPTVEINKIVVNPLSLPNKTAWGDQVTYQITVKNTSSVPLTNVGFRDLVSSSSNGAVPFDATLLALPSNLPGVPASVPDTRTLSSNNWLETWRSAVPSTTTLQPGEVRTFSLTLRFDMKSCAAEPQPNFVITNLILLTATELGGTQPSALASINMQDPPACQFKTDKRMSDANGAAPTVVQFGVPYEYQVTFTNQSSNLPARVYTLADFLRVDAPGYTQGLGLQYSYECSSPNGVLMPQGKAQSPNFPALQNGSVLNTFYPTGGSPLINMGGPVDFPANGQLSCKVKLLVQRPSALDAHCMNQPQMARLENTALIYPGVRNLNQPLPASSWAQASAELPRCYKLVVNKDALEPSATTTGPALHYVVTVTNNGSSISGLSSPNWLLLNDLIADGYLPGSVNVSTLNPSGGTCGPGPADACELLSNPGSPTQLGLKNLAAGQELVLAYTLNPPFTTAKVSNTVGLQAQGSLGNQWYPYAPNTLVANKDVPITDYVPPDELGQICVAKFNDLNGNGKQEANEPWLAGWAFTLRKQPSGPDLKGETDTSGRFCSKAALAPGVYAVTEAPQAGWVKTSPEGNKEAIIVTLKAGETKTVVFGNFQEDGKAVLKVCKVAGEGVKLGELFSFGTKGLPGGQDKTVQVPAGPAPGGWCQVVGSYPVGTTMGLYEVLRANYQIQAVQIEPPESGSVSADLQQATLELAAGVTEISFTNRKTTGFIEICKQGVTHGTYRFESPALSAPVDVPAGACSPAIEVPAGEWEFRETQAFGAPGVTADLASCKTLPKSGLLLGCQPASASQPGAVKVRVLPGGVAEQTVVIISNRPPAGKGADEELLSGGAGSR